MAKINQIRRLAIIVSKLNSKHYVPAEELVDYVSYTIRARYSDTAGCTLRTLQRDFRTIEELFGVTIRHDKLCGYYIDERYGSAEDYEALLLNFELLNAIDSDSTIQNIYSRNIIGRLFCRISLNYSMPSETGIR